MFRQQQTNLFLCPFSNGDNKLKKNCESCGQVFFFNDDDISDKKYCPKCQNPETREKRSKFFKKHEPKDQNKPLVFRDPTIFEKQMLPYELMTPEEFYGKDKWNPVRFGIQIQRTDKFMRDIKTDLFYVYNTETGIWLDEAKTFIECATAKFFGEEHKRKYSGEILAYIRADSTLRVKFNEKLIALKNGYLDPKTLEFTPFNSEENVIYSLPVKYDPEEEVPKEFMEFLNSSLDPGEKLLIQELMGYCLLPDYMFHHLFWVYGVARAGKGVWARTMNALFGRTFSSVPINHLNGHYRFAEARLFRKLCNISSEPTLKKDQKGQTQYMSVQTLNALTGKDLISAELKNIQNPIEFTNKAKIIILSNELPRVRETSDAFFQRLKIIHFNKQFLGKNQIKNYEDQWIHDPKKMSGLLNFATKGAIRVLENGDFTIPESEKELKIQFVRNNDTFNAFMEEKTISHYQAWTPKKELYEFYSKFCNENELYCLSEKDFNQKMRVTPKYREYQKGVGSKRKRGWLGLKISEEKNTEKGLETFLEKDHEKAKTAQGTQETQGYISLPEKCTKNIGGGI